jgi:hypothetical protein
MSVGFTLDRGEYGATHLVQWHPGEPVKSMWGYYKTNKSSLKPVATYRCDRCGFLEDYAF